MSEPTLRDYARIGARAEIATAMETLQKLYKLFPDEFKLTPSSLVAGSTNGAGNQAPRKPKRRKSKAQPAPRPKPQPQPSAARAQRGDPLWRRVARFLDVQPNRTATVHDICAALNVPAESSGAVYMAVKGHTEFRKVRPGAFKLTDASAAK